MTESRRNHATIHKLRTIGNAIDVSLFTQVPRERAHITCLDHRLEADVLLETQFEIIRRDRLRIDFQRTKRHWEHQRSAGAERVDVAVKDCVRRLLWRVVSQRASARAAGATPDPRRMISATHCANNRLACAKNVPGKSNARFPINWFRMPETFYGSRISRHHDSIQ